MAGHSPSLNKTYRCTGCQQKLELNSNHRNRETNEPKCVFCITHEIPYQLIPAELRKQKAAPPLYYTKD